MHSCTYKKKHLTKHDWSDVRNAVLCLPSIINESLSSSDIVEKLLHNSLDFPLDFPYSIDECIRAMSCYPKAKVNKDVALFESSLRVLMLDNTDSSAQRDARKAIINETRLRNAQALELKQQHIAEHKQREKRLAKIKRQDEKRSQYHEHSKKIKIVTAEHLVKQPLNIKDDPPMCITPPEIEIVQAEKALIPQVNTNKTSTKDNWLSKSKLCAESPEYIPTNVAQVSLDTNKYVP